ncbi:MAG TPA: phosphate-starvation-inducible PsiE family protein [Chloroflexota bacterium]|nr:phosphate-starvation-inducible PsiE family protein [Chloroflexota bacterium]
MEPDGHIAEQGFAATIDRTMDRWFEIIQRILIAAVAVVLVILSIMALWDAVVSVTDNLRHNQLTLGIAAGVDTAFLTVILLELLHTVTSRGPVAQQVQEFIVIGITSGVRHGLSLAAAASSGGRNASGSARDTVIDLAINSFSVLVLVVALWLVRHRFGTGDETAVPNDLEE